MHLFCTFTLLDRSSYLIKIYISHILPVIYLPTVLTADTMQPRYLALASFLLPPAFLTVPRNHIVSTMLPLPIYLCTSHHAPHQPAVLKTANRNGWKLLLFCTGFAPRPYVPDIKKPGGFGGVESIECTG